jgi:hypothetical protein
MTQANRERCRRFSARLREDDSSRSSESVVVLLRVSHVQVLRTSRSVLELFFVKYYSLRPKWFGARTILVRMRQYAH